MSMAAIGASAAIGVIGAGANYAISQSNKPKSYDPSANNYLSLMNQQKIADLTKGYQDQVSGYGNTFLTAEKGLANTYGNQGAGASGDYLQNTGRYLNQYAGNIANLAAIAPQNELNAAQAGLGFNAANLGNYGAIAANLSNNDQAQRLAMLNTAMPGYSQGMNQATENAKQQMQGLVPADVQASIGRSAAFGALGSGARGGSGLGRNLTARDLGLNSLQLSQQGTQNFQSLARDQYNLGVAGLQTTGANVMGNLGVNSGQAMNAAALGTNLAATGLQSELQGGLSTQGTNYGQLMNLYGNVFSTGVGANNSVMQANALAAANAMQANAGAITGNYQNQMNGNIAAYQSQNQLAAYNNQSQQQLLGSVMSGVNAAAFGYLANQQGFTSNIDFQPTPMSNGFYRTANAAATAAMGENGIQGNIGQYNGQWYVGNQ